MTATRRFLAKIVEAIRDTRILSTRAGAKPHRIINRRPLTSSLATAGAIVACLVFAGGFLTSARTLLPGPKADGSTRTPTSALNRRGQSISAIKSRFPKVDYDAPEPQDPNEKARRQNKGKHFDKLGGVSKEPTHLSAGLLNHWDMNLPAFPVQQSTAVVIAETLNRAAFLSNDRMAVYTEVAVNIEEVLKGSDVTKGQRIDINRLGGIVRYNTGEESLFFIAGQNMPDVGKRYLFFLKALADSPDYQIVTGYELGAARVQALDSPRQFTEYNGTSVDEFLAAARKAVESPQ